MRARMKLTGAGLGVAALVATAAPASADHYYTVSLDGETCVGGELATGVGIPLTTKTVKVKEQKDGTPSFRCTFTKLPRSLDGEETGNWDWERPDRAVEYSGSTCYYSTETTEWYGETTFARYTPGGTLQVECQLIWQITP